MSNKEISFEDLLTSLEASSDNAKPKQASVKAELDFSTVVENKTESVKKVENKEINFDNVQEVKDEKPVEVKKEVDFDQIKIEEVTQVKTPNKDINFDEANLLITDTSWTTIVNDTRLDEIDKELSSMNELDKEMKNEVESIQWEVIEIKNEEEPVVEEIKVEPIEETVENKIEIEEVVNEAKVEEITNEQNEIETKEEINEPVVEVKEEQQLSEFELMMQNVNSIVEENKKPVEAFANTTQEVVTEVKEEIKENVENVQEQVNEVEEEVKQDVQEIKEEIKEIEQETNEVVDNVQEWFRDNSIIVEDFSAVNKNTYAEDKERQLFVELSNYVDIIKWNDQEHIDTFLNKLNILVQPLLEEDKKESIEEWNNVPNITLWELDENKIKQEEIQLKEKTLWKWINLNLIYAAVFLLWVTIFAVLFNLMK